MSKQVRKQNNNNKEKSLKKLLWMPIALIP